MISAIILNIVFLFIGGIVALFRNFGTVTANSDIANSIAALSSYLTPLTVILPITTIIAILLFELAFEALYFTYKLIKWGYTKVPFIN